MKRCFINRLMSKFNDEKVEKEPKHIAETHIDELPFYNYIKKLYLNYGAKWDEVNLFGIRNITNMSNDIWNDWIGIAFQNKVYMYSGTTDPSVYWTMRMGADEDKKGVAHLCLGFHKDAYMIGDHRGYEALCQWGGPVKIWRDANQNFIKDDADIIQKGYFGINIHRASAYEDVTNIGKYSAGCLVVHHINDFLELMSTIKSSQMYKKNPNSKFGFFLFKYEDIPRRYVKEFKKRRNVWG